jgi:sialate O-acetylesterase
MALCALTVQAEVKLPPVFGDGMVLQRDTPAPVWGTAEKGEYVTVTIMKQTVTTTANAQGRWRVELATCALAGRGR